MGGAFRLEDVLNLVFIQFGLDVSANAIGQRRRLSSEPKTRKHGRDRVRADRFQDFNSPSIYNFSPFPKRKFRRQVAERAVPADEKTADHAFSTTAASLQLQRALRPCSGKLPGRHCPAYVLEFGGGS